jgi:hypothetical protein
MKRRYKRCKAIPVLKQALRHEDIRGVGPQIHVFFAPAIISPSVRKTAKTVDGGRSATGVRKEHFPKQSSRQVQILLRVKPAPFSSTQVPTLTPRPPTKEPRTKQNLKCEGHSLLYRPAPPPFDLPAGSRLPSSSTH